MTEGVSEDGEPSFRQQEITQIRSRSLKRGRLSLHSSPVSGRDVLEGRHHVWHFKGKRLPFVRVSARVSPWLHLESTLSPDSPLPPTLSNVPDSGCSHRRSFRAGFLRRGALDLWVLIILHLGGILCISGISVTPGLCPLDASSIYSLRENDKTQLQTWPSDPHGAKSPWLGSPDLED